MSNWWSVIKLDEAWSYINAAIKREVTKDPDIRSNQLLQILSDIDDIYDDEWIQDKDKRAITLEDINRFNKNHNRGRYSGEVILSDYQKSLIPIMQEENQKSMEEKKTPLMGSAMKRALLTRKEVNKKTIDQDIEDINRSHNDKYKDLRTMPTVRTENDNPDFAATKLIREKERNAKNKANKLTPEELKERLRANRKLEEERQRKLRRGGPF
tara:strand:- start:76 stop:711 length:636 start_codon:yes stop_codon:yes gene_type:complete